MSVNLATLVVASAKEQIKLGNLRKLTSVTGLSTHWFYRVANGQIKDPGCKATFKFLGAIDHPVYLAVESTIGATQD